MSTTEQRLAKVSPQRITRYVEICEVCRARNSFRIYRNIEGVLYAKCNKCGKNAIITLVLRASR